MLHNGTGLEVGRQQIVVAPILFNSTFILISKCSDYLFAIEIRKQKLGPVVLTFSVKHIP